MQKAFEYFFMKVKETIIKEISSVSVKSMQQVTQLTAVVVMATEGEENLSLLSQV